jgi:hypothetical protein
MHRKRTNMTGCPPPYRPLRGADPPHFVDREDPQDVLVSGILGASVAAYAAGPCDPRFHRLVLAGPAMGKTALLRAIGREVAARLGWAVALHTCKAKERAIRAVSAEVVRTLQQQWPTEVTGLMTGTPAFDRLPRDLVRDLVPAPHLGSSASPWAALKNLLEFAGQFARPVSRGLLVMFDDADRLSGGELESLGYIARSLSRDDLPVALLFSGAPLLGERLARVGCLSGCVWPTNLCWLDAGDAREALVVPAVDRGVEFQEDALDLLCRAAGGSPLELQRVGFAAWSAARGADVVTMADAQAALGLLTQGVEARAS